MASIAATAHFDVAEHAALVVGIAADLGARHDSLLHEHDRDQLLFAGSGCMSVTLADQWLTLPPGRAAWIPAGIPHRVQLRGAVAYRSVYLSKGLLATFGLTILPERALVFGLNPLLQALLTRLAFAAFDFDWAQASAQHLLQVLADELVTAERDDTQLRWPQDERIRRLLNNDEQDWVLPSLTDLAERAHVHGKTLTRLFQRDTGLSYQQWGQQWRVQRAIEALADGHGVSVVAQKLAFASDSAFIAFFRQHMGLTPGQFAQGLGRLGAE